MATSVTQVEDALEAMINLLYLIEIEVTNPAHVLKYVKMTDPSVTTLRNLLAEMYAAG